MKLAEALRIIQSVPADATAYPVTLITGNTPEPFSYFLAAHLQERLPNRLVTIKSGVFGDLSGNLARHLEQGEGLGVVLLEWSDLDPRLGLREAGRWGREVAGDIVNSVRLRLARLASLLEKHSAGSVVLLVSPTLPLPPVLPVPRRQVSAFDASLEELRWGFLAKVAGLSRVSILSAADLAQVPAHDRLDLKSWWLAGAPYQRPFASFLAERIVHALLAAPRAKGIITDLDNTLWSGILGDEGVQGVHWDLEHHAALHGIYQQFLQSMADDGVLVGIASRNDQALVEEALKREDMRVAQASLFPVEAHWQPKTESAARILAKWNIGPESVVFLDDSPLEVALMQAAFPAMDCRVFPAEDPAAFWNLLENLTDRFGQTEGLDEDVLRLSSLRNGAERQTMLAGGFSEEELLKSSQAELTIASLQMPPDPRALDLVNKTNQFNLNGVRYSESDWLKYLREGGAAWIATYRDRFGALGKIAVLAGRRSASRLDVDVWVMSCRAFSRRIEHAILDFLFQEQNIAEVVLHFEPTERNTPFREFFETYGGVRVVRDEFVARRPQLYASVTVTR